MDKEQINFQMEILIQENMLMASRTVKGNITGILVKFMLEIFIKEKSMERENGKVIKTQIIIIYTKEIILTIKNMGLEFSHGRVGTFTKEIIKTMREMETGKCYGLMEACTRENGKMEFSMALEEWFLSTGQAKKDILKIMFLNTQ